MTPLSVLSGFHATTFPLNLGNRGHLALLPLLSRFSPDIPRFACTIDAVTRQDKPWARDTFMQSSSENVHGAERAR